jgi:3-isopropylmalate/(R)-2-methylmalate dehydratase small subunit
LFTQLGVATLVADEINSLFLRNSINFGLPAVTIEGVSTAIQDQDHVRLDVRAATVERLEDGAKLTGTPLPDFVLDIVAQGGLLPKLAADGYLPVDPAMAGSGAAKGQAGGQA